MSTALRTGLFLAMAACCLWSQQSGSGAGANNTGSGKLSSALISANPLLSGMVMMEDGSPVPGNVEIKLSCNASERTVTHTTVSDDFEFQWTAPAQTGPVVVNSFTNTIAGANSDASSLLRSSVRDESGYCDLRAALPGYRSSEINLNNASEFDGTNVGVLWLRPINAHQGNMVSALSLRAPKEARKLFDKGTELLHSAKLPAAAASFQKAVTIYPRYVDAWLDLGNAQLRMGANDSAKSSLQRAIELDPKMPNAWQMLGYAAFNQKKWDDAAGYLFQAEQLDPMNSPMPWFYSAVAYYELRKYDQAEKSIRTEIDMDPVFQNHRAEYVLGMILIARHDLAGGSDALRSYLAAKPDPRDVATAETALNGLPQRGGN
jgi:tetratricopeptide (TPR) repeat protein